MPEIIGNRVRQARLRHHMTQEELAKQTGASSHTIICDLEKGKRGNKRPNVPLLVKICDVLDISLDWLFLGKEAKKKN
jgi:transcriptional regulator with XRE-family HTH domain